MIVKMPDGVEYFCEVIGQGTPLVLLHGFTGDHRTWHQMIDLWKDNFQVIVIDILGHGQTDAPDDPNRYHIEKVAKDINYILDQLQIESTHLLGYSMGGRLALTFAIEFPEKVKSLLLESTSPGLKTENDRKQRRLQDEKLAKQIMEDGLKTFVDYWENIPLFATQQRLPVETREQIRIQRLEQIPLGLANSLIGMGTGSQPSWWESLVNLKMPVFLLVGEEDEKFCLLNEEMKKSIPRANLHVFQKVGHAIHVEKPHDFGTIVKKFVEDVERGVINGNCLDK